MDINKIKEILPHRYPFLLIDKIIHFEPDISAHAVKCVTINEPFFQGHFPGRPLMPGVLVIEAIVQAACFTVAMKLKGVVITSLLKPIFNAFNAKKRASVPELQVKHSEVPIY